MARTARASVGGYCYHVLNRGNGGATVFRKSGDYRAFLGLLQEAEDLYTDDAEQLEELRAMARAFRSSSS